MLEVGSLHNLSLIGEASIATGASGTASLWIWWIGVAAVFAGLAYIVYGPNGSTVARMSEAGIWNAFGFGAASISVILWALVGRFDAAAAARCAVVSGASFCVGTLIGFLLALGEKDDGSLVRVRDWLIGGVSTLTLAGLATGGDRLGGLLAHLSIPDRLDRADIGGLIVIYGALGFFAMYVLRVTSWNIWFARKKRLAVEGAVIAGSLEQELPALEDFDPGDDLELPAPNEVPRLSSFVAEVRAAIQQGVSLPEETRWSAARAAVFTGRYEEAVELLEPIAVSRGKLQVAATVWLAACYDKLNRRDQAARSLEKLLGNDAAPKRLKKWLGRYLLWVPQKYAEAEKLGEEYLQADPKDARAWLYLACARAQLFASVAAENREKYKTTALDALETALKLDNSLRKEVLALIDEDFAELKDDRRFKKIVGT